MLNYCLFSRVFYILLDRLLMLIEIKNYDMFYFLAGRGKMTSGNMIFMMMMLNKNNRGPLVWIDSVILIFKYKLPLLDANSSFLWVLTVC